MPQAIRLSGSTTRTGSIRGALVLGLVILADPAAAQRDKDIQAMQQEIRALQRQITHMNRAVNAKVDVMRKEQQAVRKSKEVRRAETGPSLGGVTFPNGRPTFTSADGNFNLGIYGRVQMDVGTYLEDDGADLNSGWNFRRARLGVVGNVWRDFTYSLIYDFGGSPDGIGSLYEASLGYTGIKSLNLRIGAYKPFFTLEDSISSADLLFLERPSIVEIARSIAAGTARMSAGGSAAGEGWFAAAYLTGPTVGVEVDDEQVGGVARVAFQPFKGENYLVHVGASASAVFQPNQNAAGVVGVSRQTIQLRDRPELRLDSTRFLDTGVISYENAYVGGLELAAHYRNLSLQGEYLTINIEQDRATGLISPNLNFDGFYVQGSWIITGESRRYNTGSAAYAAPRIAQPFSLGEGGGWGAWELVARYSTVNLNDKDVPGRPVVQTGGARGGKQETYTVGLNWYPNQNVRFMLNYVYGDVDRLNPAGTAQIGQSFQALALRSQWSF
ncbi:MAG: porin [Stutzerimonas stutzeri]|nr:MAG: porin [Stutzerimonas stutzeri]